MKERPILLSAPMVRAILDGRKTQTRRVVKPFPFDASWANWNTSSNPRPCPYGAPGDRLWVRETWAHCELREAPDGSGERQSQSVMPGWGTHIAYAADDDEEILGYWVPSIHMPRWASRITLDVTAVRVERLQEISDEDAIAEGAFRHDNGAWDFGMPEGHGPTAARAFMRCWDSISAKYARWSSNPWVWVVEFRRVEGEEARRG